MRCGIGRFLLAWTLLLGAIPALRASSTLNFPRLSYETGVLTGIAIVNPSAQQAIVTLTAYGSSGQPLPGKTASLTIEPNQQVSRLVSQLFGTDLPPETVGWFQAVSQVDGLAGFFLVLDASGTTFDGADLPAAGKKIVFNHVRIDSGYSTELNLINPGTTDAALQLQLVGVQQTTGDAVSTLSRTLTLRANGASRLDVQSFFQASRVAAGAYVTVSTEAAVAGFELVRAPGADLLGLNAKSASEQLSHIYFPQLAVLGGWKTEIGLENYAPLPALVTLTAYRGDGRLYDTADLRNNPVTRALNAGASLREDVATAFGFAGSASLDGWIKVESTSSAVNGYLTYGIGPAVAAVTSQPQGLTRAIFSHIAAAQGFFNGVALLNAGSLTANVRVLAIQPSGRVLGTFDTVLQPGQRISRLINEMILPAAGQAGGIIWVKSDQPIYLTELFGTTNTLANVPPQAAPESYQPDGATQAFKINPPLAVVQTGAAQQFTVQGGTSGFSWRVNGVASGNPTVGSISSSGLYRAPGTLPIPQALGVTAENSSQAAGATIDVYRRLTVVESLGTIQTVAYLGSLQKLFQAELTSLSGAKPVDQGPLHGFFDTNTTVFEVTPSGALGAIATYPNEIVPKMVAFTASSGKEYLLLAGQTTGRIIRLDPATGQSVDVFSGLVEPTTMVVDSATGDLLVAERDGITSIPASILNLGLGKSSVDPSSRLSILHPQAGVEGIAVDTCTGDVYFSVNIREGFNLIGLVQVLQRSTGQVRTLFSGLRTPGPLLALYRQGISCPQALHLLLAERGAARVVLITPSDGSLITWLSPSTAADLAFIPEGSPLAAGEGVMAVEGLGPIKRRITFVGASGLYRGTPINPPLLSLNRGVEVTINPASATMVRGTSRQFNAVVTGAVNTVVTWSTTGGEVTASGLYTAPQTPGDYKLRATSQADPARFAEASVRVVGVRVTLTPTTVSLRPGATQQFSGTVTGPADTGLAWSASGGQISSTGFYTAPPTPSTYTVRATALADGTTYAEATVVVTSVQVSVTPPVASLAAGATVQFGATVTGTDNTAVTWEATGGSITDAGLYTAPDKAGSYSVRATSQADPTKFGQASVTVTLNVSVAVSPVSSVIPTGGTLQLNAVVTGSSDTGVIWTATGGTITSSGLYTAPQAPGDYKVRATSQADPTKFAEASVRASLVGISVSPTAVTLGPGDFQQFTATVTGTANTAVTWFASGGTINATGAYTAPQAAGSYTVRAISLADPSKVAEAVVTVTAVVVTVNPAKVTLPFGGRQQFTATVTGARNTAVTWSASAGTITQNGLYNAPRTFGTFVVRATSQADPGRFAEATVVVDSD